MAHPQVSPVPRKYLNQKSAATYCGYGVETFRKYLTEYNIPRKGPDNTKYCVDDLDKFMANPFEFCLQRTRRTRELQEYVS